MTMLIIILLSLIVLAGSFSVGYIIGYEKALKDMEEDYNNHLYNNNK